MLERADLLKNKIDLSQLTPNNSPNEEHPPPEAVRTVAEELKLQSWAPVRTSTTRQQRRYRTGRNIQLNTKVTTSTRDGFYEISDRYNWVLGETLERALQALKRELDRDNAPDPKEINEESRK